LKKNSTLVTHGPENVDTNFGYSAPFGFRVNSQTSLYGQTDGQTDRQTDGQARCAMWPIRRPHNWSVWEQTFSRRQMG